MDLMDSEIRTIRADVQTERASINELDCNLTSAYLKARLREASDILNDVEGWLAPPNERRTAAEATRWLDFVDGILAMAVRRRLYVQELAKRFGPDIETL
jgi:hypothetical protein